MNTKRLDQCANGSFQGSISFPEIVEALLADGVTWYSANLIFRVTTYYNHGGGHHQAPWPEVSLPPLAADFDAAKVQSAIKASQNKEIGYRGFLARIAEAGVVYYTVHMTGRKAIYFGEHGDFHIEAFPTAS